MGLLACGSAMSQGAGAPELWQSGAAGTNDAYYGGRCDTVITRTCGHGVTVTAARMLDERDRVSNHRFVVRCTNGQKYFLFDILPAEQNIMPAYTMDRCYYIHDMLISDGVCFFCGTQVARMRFLADSLVPGIRSDTIFTEGFFGRFDLDELQRNLQARHITKDGNSDGSKRPFPVDFALIPQTSALESLWESGNIFDDDGLGRDSTAKYRYLIGRLHKGPNRSCLLKMAHGLYDEGYGDTMFKLLGLEIPEEYSRTLLSSLMSCEPKAAVIEKINPIDNFSINWTTIRALATKHNVTNHCTKSKNH